MINLDGKVAIVTGGGRGIGRAIATSLASVGATVVVADLDDETATTTADDIAGSGGRAVGRRLDVRDVDAIHAHMDQVADEFGGIDILVNNAAVTRVIGFMDITPEDFDSITAVNLRGLFFALQSAVPHMVARGGGHVVNISSISAKHKDTSNAVYSSTKGAILSLTRTAASQLGHLNITVNAVCPGATETEMNKAWAAQQAAREGVTVEKLKARLTRATALGRINTPDDIGWAVTFLASPMARNITGQSLNVDNGVVWD